MDRSEIVDYLKNFIVDYGNADIILNDRNGEYHYTDFSVADLNYVIAAPNKNRIELDRIEIVLNICDREIKRQETFMRCAEAKDNDALWLKHYDLQGVYQMIKDILTGQLKEDF